MTEIAAKALLGGVFVVLFALLSEAMTPKRFAGVFAAAPSVALASLLVTVVAKGAGDARLASVGMTAGAVAFTAYCLAVPAALRRWGALRGAVATVGLWLVVAAAGYLVLP